MAKFVAILGGGPSLTQEQVDRCRERAHVIALNRAWELAPWADRLHGPDLERFWRWHSEALAFAGRKSAVAARARSLGLVQRVREFEAAGGLVYTCGETTGLAVDPDVVNGRCAVHHALNICLHLGVERVLLLGIDMRGGHWHDGYPWEPGGDRGFERRKFELATTVEPLRRAGIEVINYSPGSALECFPKGSVSDGTSR